MNIESASHIKVDYEGKSTSIVLLGVNTWSHTHHMAEPLLRDLLVGEWVYLRFGDEKKVKGYANRLQAYIYRAPDGLFVNLEMIRLGYGQVLKHLGDRIKLFQHYGDRAKTETKGIWNKPKEIKVKTLWD